MNKLRWTDECKLGFDEIDSQHRLLFAIANELLEIENPVRQQDEIKFLLHHLIDYTEFHFKAEEEFFTKHRYPGVNEHRARHQEILKEISETVRSSKNMIELKDSLDTMLDNWIRVHVLFEDKKFYTWIQYKKTK